MSKRQSQKTITLKIKVDPLKVKDENAGFIIDNLHRGTGAHRSKKDFRRHDKHTKNTRDYL